MVAMAVVAMAVVWCGSGGCGSGGYGSGGYGSGVVWQWWLWQWCGVAVVAVTSHIAVGEGPEKPYCRLLIHFDMDQF